MIGRIKSSISAMERLAGKTRRHSLPRLSARMTGATAITADTGAREVVTGAQSTIDLTNVVWPCSGSDTGCVSNFTSRKIRGFVAYAAATNLGPAVISDGSYPLLGGGTITLQPGSTAVGYFVASRPLVSSEVKTIGVALDDPADEVQIVLIGGA